MTIPHGLDVRRGSSKISWFLPMFKMLMFVPESIEKMQRDLLREGQSSGKFYLVDELQQLQHKGGLGLGMAKLGNRKHFVKMAPRFGLGKAIEINHLQ